MELCKFVWDFPSNFVFEKTPKIEKSRDKKGGNRGKRREENQTEAPEITRKQRK